MIDITGKKDILQREEVFLQAQQSTYLVKFQYRKAMNSKCIHYSGCSDESDEFSKWESQQIRKGVNVAQLSNVCQHNSILKFQEPETITSSKIANKTITADLLSEAYKELHLSNPPSIRKNNGNKIVALKAPEEIMANMIKRVKEIKNFNKNHRTELQQLNANIDLMKVQKENCEKKIKILSEQHEFYQQVRGYLADLTDCFNEKIPMVKALEAQVLSIYANQAKLLIERRRQDVRDQAKEAGEINQPGNLRKLDTEDQIRNKRVAEREGRRTRRRRERERDGFHETHMNGMSTDDEVSDLLLVQYRENLNEVAKKASIIFQDVNEYFSELKSILALLEEWKQKYPDSYNEAFVQLCIPRICGPIVKCQMITWNPLEENCPDLEEMSWFSDCVMYTTNNDENEEALINDIDSRLIPTIIEKVVIPRLNDLVQECWDPLSSTKTLKLVKLMRKLVQEYPSIRSTSNSLRSLFSTIHDKMKTTIESDVYIPLFPNQ